MILCQWELHRQGGVKVSVLALSVVDRGFKPYLGLTKTMKLECVASLLSTQH